MSVIFLMQKYKKGIMNFYIIYHLYSNKMVYYRQIFNKGHLDKYKNHIRTTTPVGPIDQHDRQRKHDYKHNEERNKTKPLLYKT